MKCAIGLATEERRKSFLFPRPSLDMSIWKMAMPHLWMLLSTNDGLPPRHGQGLWVPPPALPAVLEDAAVSDEACHQVYDQVSLNVSFCTAHVNSLHRAPDGHAGKVKYLRHQFKQLCLLFLGLQETRSPEFTSCVDGVLRLAGGCSGHQTRGRAVGESFPTLCACWWCSSLLPSRRLQSGRQEP